MKSVPLLALLAVTAGCAGSPESSPPRAPLTNAAADPITRATPSTPATPRQHTGEPPAGTCYVDFLDIGSGLATLIRCKNTAGEVLNIVYDGGSNDSKLRSKFRLVYLLDTGLGFKPGSTIHHLFQSHPHFDHHSELIRAGGVLAQYDVKHVWDPAAINDTVAYGCFIKGVIDKANAGGLIYHPARKCPDFSALRCDRGAIPAWRTPKTSIEPFDAPSRSTPAVAAKVVDFGFAGVTGKILHADPTAKSNPNDATLVLKLELFGVKVLLTGDEEAGRYAAADTPPTARSVEQFLIDSKADLTANIVQIPHHGSETSSSNLLQKATLQKYREKSDTFAVISSGPKDYSGKQLPTPRIVESWKAKVGRSHVLSTRLNDSTAPLCTKNPDKIAPTPLTDETQAGCNNIEFTIENKPKGRKITTVAYWPLGPEMKL